MHGQRAPPPSAATTPEVDIGRKQRLRSESGLPGWMRSVTQCGRPSGGRKPSLNNTDQTYATNHDELHSRDDDDFDDASSVSTTVSSEMNADLLDTSLEACSFGSFAVGAQDTAGKARRRGKGRGLLQSRLAASRLAFPRVRSPARRATPTGSTGRRSSRAQQITNQPLTTSPQQEAKAAGPSQVCPVQTDHIQRHAQARSTAHWGVAVS